MIKYDVVETIKLLYSRIVYNINMKWFKNYKYKKSIKLLSFGTI